MLLLSTSYFPTIGYMAHLVRAGGACIDIRETYRKQTWRNRCVVLTGNGPVNLTIPVEKPGGNHTPTAEIIASSHYLWQSNHWKTISSAYRGAPFFTWYADLVKDGIFGSGSNLLFMINDYILKAIFNEFNIAIDLTYTDEFISDSSGCEDHRFSITPKLSVTDQLLKDIFPPYYQVFSEKNGFYPDASVVDLLFNLGPDAILYLKDVAKDIS